MKKNLRLALQTSGFAALLALTISSIPGIAQADENEPTEVVTPTEAVTSDSTNDEAGDDTDDTAAIENLTVESSDSEPARKQKEKKWVKHLQSSLKTIQENPASLKTSFNELKDPAMLLPKGINDITALANSDERRMELYKLSIAPISPDVSISAEDKTAFTGVVNAIVADSRKTRLQTRELLITMLVEKNFTYMSEKEIKEALKALNPKLLHGRHRHGKHANKKNDKKGKKDSKVENKNKKGKKGKKDSTAKHKNKKGKKDSKAENKNKKGYKKSATDTYSSQE
jgi:hypothetical protein